MPERTPSAYYRLAERLTKENRKLEQALVDVFEILSEGDPSVSCQLALERLHRLNTRHKVYFP